MYTAQMGTHDSHKTHTCTHLIIHVQHPISFALYLCLSEDSLSKTLDYSHHNASLPPGAKVNDEADNSRAKVINF